MTDILQKKEWNTRQVVTVVIVAISITFSATMIWSRFLTGEANHTILSERVEKKYDRLNSRIDKFEEKIKELELHNTDK